MAAGDVKGTLTVSLASITNPTDATGSVSVAVGDLVFGVIAQQTNLTASGTVTDNLGNTYAYVNAGVDVGNVTARAFYAYVSNSGTLTTIHVPATASVNDASVTASVFEGPFATSPLDAAATVISDSTSPWDCPASGTLAQAYELVIGYAAINSSQTPSASIPFAMAGNVARANASSALSKTVVNSTASVTPTFTGSSILAGLGTASFKFANSMPSFSFVQAKSYTTGSIEDSLQTSPVTFDNATTSGNAIIVAVSHDASSNRVVTSVTDNKSNPTFSQVGTYFQDANLNNLYLYYCPNITGGASHTVNVNFNDANASYKRIIIMEVSGLHLTSPLDQATTGKSVTSATPADDSMTTVGDGEFVVSFFGATGGTASDVLNAISPFIEASSGVTAGSGANEGVLFINYQNAHGSITPSCTRSTSGFTSVRSATFFTPSGGTSYQGNALLAGASTEIASAAQLMSASALLAGASSVTANATFGGVQLTLAGNGSFTSSALLRESASAVVAGVAALSASTALYLPATPATFAGASAFLANATVPSALAYVATVTNGATDGANFTLDIVAAGVQTDDLVVVMAGSYNRSGNEARIGNAFSYNQIVNTTSGNQRGRVAWKIYAGEGNPTVEGSGNTSDAASAVAIILRGADQGVPITQLGIATGSSTNPNAPSVIPYDDNCAVLAFATSLVNDATPGTVSGYLPTSGHFSNQSDTNSNTTAGQYKLLSGGRFVSEDPAAYSSWSTAAWVAVTVVVRATNLKSFTLGTVPFAASSSWNRPVGETVSSALNWVGQSFNIAWSTNSAPIYVCSDSDPLVAVAVSAGWGWPAQTVFVHLPVGATGSPDSDGHLVAIDRDTTYNFYQFSRTNNTAATATTHGATSVTTGSGWGQASPFLAAGAIAAGCAFLAGVVTQAETDAGAIQHAIEVNANSTLVRSGAVGEAINSDGASGTGQFYEASRLRIPASTSMPGGLSTLGQKFFTTLQTYGMFIVDVAGGNTTFRFQQNAFDSGSISSLASDLSSIIPLTELILGYNAVANLNGAGVLSASAVEALRASTTLNVASTLTVNAQVTRIASTLIPGVGAFTASAILQEQASALFSSASVLLGSSALKISATPSLFAGVSVFFATSKITTTGSSVFAGIVAITSAVNLYQIASARLSSASDLMADVSKHYGSAELDGSATLSTAAIVRTTGSALYAVDSAVIASIGTLRPASSLLAGASTFTGLAVRFVPASALLVSASAFLSSGVVVKFASAQLDAQGTLAPFNSPLFLGASTQLSAVGGIGVAATYVPFIYSTLAGSAQLFGGADYLAPAFVSSVNATPGTGSIIGPSSSISTPANSPLILVIIAIASATVDVTSLTITGFGGTASLVTSVLSNYAEQYTRLSIWKIVNPTPNTVGTVQANLSGSAPYEMVVETFELVNLTDPCPNEDAVIDNTTTTPATLTPANMQNNDRVSGGAATVTSVLNHITSDERYYDSLLPVELAVGDGRSSITAGLLDSGRQYAKAAVRIRALGPTLVNTGAIFNGASVADFQALIFHPAALAGSALFDGALTLNVGERQVSKASVRLAGAGAMTVNATALSRVQFGSSVNVTPGTGISVTSPSITTPTNNPAVIVHVSIASNTVTLNSLTITGFGGTATQVATILATYGASYIRYYIWKITGPTANTAGTVRANFSASVAYQMVVETFSGVDQQDASPNADAVTDNTATSPQTLTPSNLSSLDATSGGGGNSAAQDLGAVTPNSRYLGNTTAANLAVGDNTGTSGIGVSVTSTGNYAKIAARIKAAAVSFWQGNALLSGVLGLKADATWVFGGYWPGNALLQGSGSLYVDGYPLSWVVGDSSLLVVGVTLREAAYAQLLGAGALRADAITNSGIGPYTGAILNGATSLSVSATLRLLGVLPIWAGVGAFAATATSWIPVTVRLDGASTVFADALHQGQLSGAALLAVTGQLGVSYALLASAQGTLQGVSNTQADTTLRLAAAAVCSGDSSLAVSTYGYEAAIVRFDGTAALAVDGIRTKPGSVLIPGIAALVANADQLMATTSVVLGAGSLTADGRQIWATSALLAPSGVVKGAALIGPILTGETIPGAGAVRATALQRIIAATSLAGAGAVLSLGQTIEQAQALLAGLSTVTNTAQVAFPGTSLMSGASALAASSVQYAATSALLNNASDLQTQTIQKHWISGESFVGTSVIYVTPTNLNQYPVNLTLAGMSSWLINTIQKALVYPRFDGVGSVTVSEVQRSLANARLGGVATALTAASLALPASAKFAGVGSSTASAALWTSAYGALTVASNIIVDASSFRPASAALGVQSDIGSSTTLRIAALMQGTIGSALGVNGIVARPAIVPDMVGDSSCDAAALAYLAALSQLSVMSTLDTSSIQYASATNDYNGAGVLLPVQAIVTNTLETTFISSGVVYAYARLNSFFGDTGWGISSAMRSDAEVRSVTVTSLEVTASAETVIEVGRSPMVTITGKAQVKRTSS